MSYSSEVLADSPLAYYRLGEASGTTMADSSGHGRDGLYVNGPTLGVTGLLVGDSDTAIGLAVVGSDSPFGYVTDDNSMDGLATFTVEAIVKTTASTGQIASRDDQTSGRSFQFGLSAGKLQFVKIAGSVVVATSPGAINDGAAHHVAATYDGATIRVYVDGSQVATASATGTLGTVACDFRIGARRSSVTTDYFTGTVDEVAVYGTALSATRISAHYNAATVAGAAGTISATLPPLSASLTGGIEFSGTISASLPALGASLAGETFPPGIAGDIAATLPPLGASLAGAYSDTATLAAILPPLSASLAGTAGPPPVSGTLAATLPALRSTLAGQSFKPGTEGYVEAILPALTASLSGDVLGRAGLGLALDSSAVLTVEAALEPEPTVPPGTPSTALHIIAPTVPVPTLVAGRPQ